MYELVKILSKYINITLEKIQEKHKLSITNKYERLIFASIISEEDYDVLVKYLGEKKMNNDKIIRDALLRITQLYLTEYEDTYLLYNGINQTELTKEEYELLKEWLKDDSKG